MSDQNSLFFRTNQSLAPRLLSAMGDSKDIITLQKYVTSIFYYATKFHLLFHLKVLNDDTEPVYDSKSGCSHRPPFGVLEPVRKPTGLETSPAALGDHLERFPLRLLHYGLHHQVSGRTLLDSIRLLTGKFNSSRLD